MFKAPAPVVLAHYHEPQTHYQPWHRARPPPPPRRPADLMTDVVNDLGTRILQQYVEKGNVAFSPAGVGFILAALYEGAGGRSRQQIADCLGLPRDRNVIRIGMRDIHRRLRVRMRRARDEYDGLLPNGEDDVDFLKADREKRFGKGLFGNLLTGTLEMLEKPPNQYTTCDELRILGGMNANQAGMNVDDKNEVGDRIVKRFSDTIKGIAKFFWVNQFT